MAKIRLTTAMVLGLVVCGNVGAEACSYREALIAYENGNQRRGDALMKMAANDGDSRAVAFLRSVLPTYSQHDAPAEDNKLRAEYLVTQSSR